MTYDAAALFVMGLALGFIPTFLFARMDKGDRISWGRLDYIWLMILMLGFVPQIYAFHNGIKARELPVKATLAVDRRVDARNWARFVIRDCEEWADTLSTRIDSSKESELPISVPMSELWKQQLATYSFSIEWFTAAADLLNSDDQAYRFGEYASDGNATKECYRRLTEIDSTPSWLIHDIEILNVRVAAAISSHDEYLKTSGHSGPKDSLVLFLLFSFLLFGLSIGIRTGKAHATIRGLTSRDAKGAGRQSDPREAGLACGLENE